MTDQSIICTTCQQRPSHPFVFFMTYSKIFHNKIIKQIFVLYGAMLIGIFLGFGVSILNTRFLSVENYGKLKFIQQLFALTATVLSFGFSYSGARLVARSKNTIYGEVIGATVIIYSVISFLSMCAILFLSSVIDEIFDAEVAYYIRQVSPLIFVCIFTVVIENLFQGANKIYSLAFFRIAPQFLYIAGSLVFIIVASHFNLSTALLLNLGLAGVVTIWMILALKPRFGHLKKSVKDIWQENRVNGSHVYVGSLANVATAQLIGIALGYYADMKSVGYYSLALVVTTPLQFIPSVMGTTLFKSFANQSSISSRAILGAVLPTAGSLIVYWLIIDKVLVLMYSDKYLPVVFFARILSIGMTFHGLGDFFNRFLGAHGKGKELRNAAFWTGVTIITGCIVLLPRYGAVGAAAVKTFSSFVYLLVTSLYYKKTVTDLSSGKIV